MRIGNSAIQLLQQQSSLYSRSSALDLQRTESAMNRYKECIDQSMRDRLKQTQVVNELKEAALHIDTWA